MAKADIVAAQKAAIVSGQDAVLDGALGACYDQGGIDQAAIDNAGVTQDQLNAAVKAATDPLNAQIAQLQAQDASDVKAGQDALAQAQSAMADLQSKFDALAQKEGQESGVIQGLQGSLAQMQQVVSILQGILQPAPVPVPVPAPDPTPIPQPDPNQPQPSA